MLIKDAMLAARQHLGQVREQLNRTSSSVVPGSTSVVFEFSTQLPTAGSQIELRGTSGSELAHVWSVNTATKTATVLRAQGGTTELSHGSGTLVAIDPTLPDQDIYQAVVAEIASLPGDGLYRARESQITFDYSREGYEIVIDDYLGPLAVVLTMSNRDMWAYDWVSEPELLRLPTRPIPDGNVATLHYRAPFATPTSQNDDLATLGIPSSAHDIVGIGAAVRLVYSREQLRSQVAVQTHARKPEDVPPGSGARSVQLLEVWKQNRLSTETRRLREKFPRRRN